MKRNNKLYDDFTNMAIDVLTEIPNVSSIDEISVKGHTPHEIREFLYECGEHGYVNFVGAYRDANFNPHADRLIPPGLTIEGQCFLNSLYSSNALKNARFAKGCSIAAVLVSLLSVISNIVLVYLSIK